MEVEQSVLHANHPHIMATLTNIGHVFKSLGQHKDALNAYLRVHNLQKDNKDVDNVAVAETLSHIGLIQYQRGDYESSFESYQEALRVRRDHYGTDDHPDIASTLNSIGLTLFKQEMYQLAKGCFSQSLETRRKLLGPDHRDVAILWYNLATIHFEMGEDDTAIDFYKETLRIERKCLGEDHHDVSITLQHVAQVLQNIGNLEDALKYFEEALRIQRKSNKSGSRATIGKLLNLIGNVNLQLGHTKPMMDCYSEASRLYRELDLPASTLVIAGYNMYGLRKIHPPCAPIA